MSSQWMLSDFVFFIICSKYVINYINMSFDARQINKELIDRFLFTQDEKPLVR